MKWVKKSAWESWRLERWNGNEQNTWWTIELTRNGTSLDINAKHMYMSDVVDSVGNDKIRLNPNELTRDWHIHCKMRLTYMTTTTRSKWTEAVVDYASRKIIMLYWCERELSRTLCSVFFYSISAFCRVLALFHVYQFQWNKRQFVLNVWDYSVWKCVHFPVILVFDYEIVTKQATKSSNAPFYNRMLTNLNIHLSFTQHKSEHIEFVSAHHRQRHVKTIWQSRKTKTLANAIIFAFPLKKR